MNDSEEADADVPPEHLLSDYLQIAYLAIALLIGIPANVYILIKLFRDRKQAQDNSIKASFLLLNINLNISDLLLLLIVAFGKICWIVTYAWYGGDLLCKTFHFLTAFSLYISSNIVVCIALDRLRNVIAISKIRSGKHATRTVKWSIVVSWILAAAWSFPQFSVWQTINVYPKLPGGWIQCSDIWSIEKFMNTNEHSEKAQTLYNLAHLVLVFWGPLVLMMFSYIFIAVRLLHYSMTDPCRKNAAFGSIIEIESSSHQVSCPAASQTELEKEKTSIVVDKTSTIRNNSKVKRVGGQKTTYYFKNVCCIDGSEQEASETSLYQICTTTRSHGGESKASEKRKPLLQPAMKHQHSRWNISSGYSVPKRPNMPVWRRQLRSRIFRTTLLVVITHILFWFPYNFFSLVRYINAEVYVQMSDHANLLKDLQIVIALINPFLYGFGS